jgi:hypothetical protein
LPPCAILCDSRHLGQFGHGYFFLSEDAGFLPSFLPSSFPQLNNIYPKTPNYSYKARPFPALSDNPGQRPRPGGQEGLNNAFKYVNNTIILW